MEKHYSDSEFLRNTEYPLETLSIEFKRTTNVRDKFCRSKLAKEICALCNFGGGWIVLGKENDGSYLKSLPSELKLINHDTINQISSEYLEPAPNCEVRWVKPGPIRYEIPVIRVPSLEKVPVFATKDGPIKSKNNIVGVKKGLIYYRASGPRSTQFETSQNLREIINKTTLNESINFIQNFQINVFQR